MLELHGVGEFRKWLNKTPAEMAEVLGFEGVQAESDYQKLETVGSIPSRDILLKMYDLAIIAGWDAEIKCDGKIETLVYEPTRPLEDLRFKMTTDLNFELAAEG